MMSFFSFFRSFTVSSFVLRLLAASHPPCCIACHHFQPVTLHNIGFLCQAITLSSHNIHLSRGLFLRMGHASSGEYISLACVCYFSPYYLFPILPFYYRASGGRGILTFPLVSIYIPLIYLFTCLSASCFADFLRVARCSYREIPLRALVITSCVTVGFTRALHRLL